MCTRRGRPPVEGAGDLSRGTVTEMEAEGLAEHVVRGYKADGDNLKSLLAVLDLGPEEMRCLPAGVSEPGLRLHRARA